MSAYICAIIYTTGTIDMKTWTLSNIIEFLCPASDYTLKRDTCPHLYDPSLSVFYTVANRSRATNHLTSSITKQSIEGDAILLYWDDRIFTVLDVISLSQDSERIDIERWKKEQVPWYEVLRSRNQLNGSSCRSVNLKLN